MENPIKPEDLKCSICKEFLDKPVVTPCGHIYCFVCLEHWRASSNTCPLCKAKIPSDVELSCCVILEIATKYYSSSIKPPPKVENVSSPINNRNNSNNKKRKPETKSSVVIVEEDNDDNEALLTRPKRRRNKTGIAEITPTVPYSNKKEEEVITITNKGQLCDECIKKYAFGYTNQDEMNCTTRSCYMYYGIYFKSGNSLFKE